MTEPRAALEAFDWNKVGIEVVALTNAIAATIDPDNPMQTNEATMECLEYLWNEGYRVVHHAAIATPPATELGRFDAGADAHAETYREGWQAGHESGHDCPGDCIEGHPLPTPPAPEERCEGCAGNFVDGHCAEHAPAPEPSAALGLCQWAPTTEPCLGDPDDWRHRRCLPEGDPCPDPCPAMPGCHPYTPAAAARAAALDGLVDVIREEHRPVAYHWSQSGESGTVCAASVTGLHSRVTRWPCSVESAIVAAFDRLAVRAEGLDGAWAEVERALPEGWWLHDLCAYSFDDHAYRAEACSAGTRDGMSERQSDKPFGTRIYTSGPHEHAFGSTPAEALRNLAQALAARARRTGEGER